MSTPGLVSTSSVRGERVMLVQKAWRRRDLHLLMLACSAVAIPITLACDSRFTASQTAMAFSLLVASWTDLNARKIYNWTTYPALLWGMGVAAAASLLSHCGWQYGWLSTVQLPAAFAGAVVTGGLTLLAYFMSRGGAGDVKIALAIGATLGPVAGFWAVALTYISAAVFVLVSGLFDGSLAKLLCGLVRLVGSKWTPVIGAPSDEQQSQLLRPVPLAGFFTLAYVVVLILAPQGL